jgi:hypothetical protein
MREMVRWGTAAVVLAFGAPGAFAMTGGGNLSPEESPYAILEPQTVAPLAAPIMGSEVPTGALYRAPARLPRNTHRATKTP